MQTTVSARLDSRVKESAESILSAIGLTHSTAIAALYSQIVLQKGLPFEAKLPEIKKSELLTYWQIRDTVRKIAMEYGINRVWLFGSYARGDATSNSDVDLLIDKGSLKGLELGGFAYDLESQFGVDVDVITTLGASPDFLESIQSEKELLYAR